MNKVGVHTCTSSAAGATSYGTSKVLAQENVGMLSAMSANDAKMSLKSDLGVSVSRSTVQRARCGAVEVANGCMDEEFSKFADYLKRLSDANPGTYSSYEKENRAPEGSPPVEHFRRSFVALPEAIRAFRLCLPIVFLDGCHLTGHYVGMLLIAVAKDANSNIVPLAVTMCPMEDTANWGYFATHFNRAFGQLRGETILSDRLKGLGTELDAAFPDCCCVACVKHLAGNMSGGASSVGKRDVVLNATFRLAKEKTVQGLASAIREESSAHSRLSTALTAVKDKWADCHLSGYRCDEYTQNASESVNAALLDARGKGIITLHVTWRRLTMTWFAERSAKLASLPIPNGLFKIVNTVFRGRVQDSVEKARTLVRTPTQDDNVVEVLANGDHFTVNTVELTCTCRRPSLEGIPCSHLICASDDSVLDCVAPFLKDEALRGIYIAVPEATTMPEDLTDLHASGLLPMMCDTNPRGRPARIQCNGDKKKQCSRCGGVGHAATYRGQVRCKRPIPDEWVQECSRRKRMKGGSGKRVQEVSSGAPVEVLAHDVRVPISLHVASGEGRVEGECGWAATNWILDFHKEARVPYSVAMHAQSMLQTVMSSFDAAETCENQQGGGYFTYNTVSNLCLSRGILLRHWGKESFEDGEGKDIVLLGPPLDLSDTHWVVAKKVDGVRGYVVWDTDAKERPFATLKDVNAEYTPQYQPFRVNTLLSLSAALLRQEAKQRKVSPNGKMAVIARRIRAKANTQI